MNITGLVKYVGKLGTGGNSTSMFVGLKLDQPGRKQLQYSRIRYGVNLRLTFTQDWARTFPNRARPDRLLFAWNRLEPIQVFTLNRLVPVQVFTRGRSGTVPNGSISGPAEKQVQLGLQKSKSSFGSISDRSENGPVQTEGLYPVDFGPDPFGTSSM